MHGVFKTDARIEEPLPGRSRHDERERHRIEVDRPQETFGPDLLVEQDCQPETEHGADGDIERGEDRQVAHRPPPVRQRPQFRVIAEPDEIVGRQHLAVRHRQEAGIGNEAIDKDQDDKEARGKDQLRYQVLQAAAAIHERSPLLARPSGNP
ncbi:hypothetical protein D9M72_510510 [compost metagenome]